MENRIFEAVILVEPEILKEPLEDDEYIGFFEGVASTPEVDLDGDRFLPEVLRKNAESLKDKPILLIHGGVKMRIMDSETGLPIEAVEKIKQIIKKLEEENAWLREEVEKLKNENEELKHRVSIIEGGGLGVSKEEESVKFIPSVHPVAELNSSGEFRPVQPIVMTIGSADNYINNIVAANITVASRIEDKINIIDVEKDFEAVSLPMLKKYRRIVGDQEEEVGFIVNELPDILRRGSRYDLKTLVEFLA